MDLISIDTTRYSAVVSAFAASFPQAVVMLDNKVQTNPVLLWCTNARLHGAVNLSMHDGETELLGFHDGPRNMWASTKALELVEKLAEQKILRFSVSQTKPTRAEPSLLARILDRRA